MAKPKNSKKEIVKNEANTSNSKKKTIIIIIVVAVVASVAYLMSTKKEENIITKNDKQFFKTAYEFKKEGELTFLSAKDEFISRIDIEIASSDEERIQGLMYRNKMNENEGMFFIFDYETPQSFWMKNTLISLDIIYVNKNNEIVKIQKNTQTLSENSYPSGKPAIYVVEVIAGYCEKYDIKENDKIVWRRN